MLMPIHQVVTGGLRRPKDDDRDGLFDEDFPDDLDGTGIYAV